MVATKNKSSAKKTNDSDIISAYMNYVLENENKPVSIYKFCKSISVDESDFYNHFGSIESLEKMIWSNFLDHTLKLITKSKEYAKYDSRQKLLTFYFTFFELLTANRSYVLFTLKAGKNDLENLSQFTELRKSYKNYLKQLEQTSDENLQFKENTTTALKEGAWIQLLLTIKFWLDDTSPAFEKTDQLIEKSINTTFDLLDQAPVKGIIDLAKFLIKEKLN